MNGGSPRIRLSRRDIMAAGSSATAALVLGTAHAGSIRTASGFVFEDRNGSGRRERGQSGIAGVMVSNGRDVVLTDVEGRWRLPVADGDSLFVIKPADWVTPVAEGGVPCFSVRRAGIADAGRGPDSIDFPLTRRLETASFDVLMFADTQPADDTELGYLRDDIVAGALATTAAFGINHGDVVFDNHALYPRYLEILGATGIAWHHCPGNHDIDQGAGDDITSRETWQRVFGPRHYAFQHAGATFIMLDNVFYIGQRPGVPGTGTYRGRIGERQLDFVRNVLAHVPNDQLVVLSMHIPLQTYQDPSDPADNTADRTALLRILQNRQHSVSFSGHMHLTEHHYLAAEGGGPAAPHHHHVLTAASGAWWGGPLDGRGIPTADSADGNPNGFHILSVKGADYTTRFVPAVAKGSALLRAVIDVPARRHASSSGTATKRSNVETIAAGELPGCDLVVNVFDGGPRTAVTCEIAGRASEPIRLQRTEMADPYVRSLFARSASVQKPWVRALPSSHVWRVSLPLDLRPGVHRAIIRAIDEYGRLSVTHKLIEVCAEEPTSPKV